ncbi:MAG: pilus assembly protein PilE [Thalassolituus sp.]|nr:MAG: pilus assembly protein PilE [Thalassolituus sp.]
MRPKYKSTGFTLVELMVAVAIIAIIATAAIPQYNQYIRRADRSDGIAAMQSLLNAQERFFLSNRTDTTNLADLNVVENDNDPFIAGSYSISARQCRDGNDNAIPLTLCVEFAADSTGSQVQDGDLFMNSMGRSQRVDSNGVEHDI